MLKETECSIILDYPASLSRKDRDYHYEKKRKKKREGEGEKRHLEKNTQTV